MSVPELPEDFDVFSIREHPIAALFPMLTEAELRDLGHDIQDRGLESAVTVCEVDGEWLLLDGRNRRAACRMVGAECLVKAYDRVGGHAGFVVSQNLKRRHMTDGQRSVVAAEIANLTHGQNQRYAESPIGDSAPAEPPVTQAEAAKLLNVTKRSVERARQVIKTGTPELVGALKAGEVSVSAAATVAKLPVEQQRKAVAEHQVTEVAKETREARPAKEATPDQAAADEPFDVDMDTMDAIEELDAIVAKWFRNGLDSGRMRRALQERIRSWAWEDGNHPERKAT